MTSKLSVKLYKGNYKWVQNQLRLFAAYKVFGVLDPRKASKSLGGETHRRDPYQALPPRLPVHLVPVVQAIFSKCCTLATLPTMAALWIFLRSLSWVRYPGWKLIPWPLSLTELMEEPKGDTPILLLKQKIFFIAEPMDSKHTSALHSPLNPAQALQASQSCPSTTSQMGSSMVWSLSSQNDRC